MDSSNHHHRSHHHRVGDKKKSSKKEKHHRSSKRERYDRDKKKKSKHHFKKNKNPSNDEGERGGGRGSENDKNNLTSLLSYGVLAFPNLMHELPQIIAAIDNCQYVNVDAISDPSFRQLVDSILCHLPAEKEIGMGWRLRDKDHRISGTILKRLLDTGAIKQPTELNMSERTASQVFPGILAGLLARYPQLTEELPVVFENLLSGNAIQLDDIDNDDIREALEKILSTLDLDNSADGVCLPDDEGTAKKTRRRRRSVVKESVEAVLRSFESHKMAAKSLEGKGLVACSGSSSANSRGSDDVIRDTDSKEGHRKSKRPRYSSGSSSSSSDKNDGSDSDSSNGSDSDGFRDAESSAAGDNESVSSTNSNRHINRAAVAAAGVRYGQSVSVVGPSMPTREQLAAAAATATHFYKSSDSDEDSDIGPAPYDPRKHQSAQQLSGAARYLSTTGGAAVAAAAPLGLTGVVLAAPAGPKDPHIEDSKFKGFGVSSTGGSGDEDGAHEHRSGDNDDSDPDMVDGQFVGYKDITEREDWILNPGSNRDIAALNDSTTISNRKFATGKQAKKLAFEVSQQKARAAAAAAAQHLAELDPEKARAQQEAAEHMKALRGPTLMEQFHEKKNQAKEERLRSMGGGGGKALPRRAFDRDIDMPSHRQLNSMQVKELQKEAKQLDSRFDKGSVQTSFL